MAERVTFADLLKKAEEKKKIEVNPKLEVVPSLVEKPSEVISPTPPTLATLVTLPTHRTSPTPGTQNKKLPAAPEKDFTRVANSIVRDAVPQKIFIGKSKQIYDFLYLQTRGAIQPKRSIRVTKLNLMRGSGIGSERTLLKNLNHLKSVGFIKVTEFDGQHGGNEYEVFLPEESQATPPTSPTAQQAHYSLQKVGTLPPVESRVGGAGQIQENKDSYSDTKTSLKTNTNDDEAFAGFVEKVQAASKKLTGKKLSKYEKDNLERLADLLILELEIAARRTENISSVPAFLTEVLRRKLRDTSTTLKPTKVKIDTVGKSEPDSYEIKALDRKGREAALNELSEFADDQMLQDFKKWYTEEDWEWLMEKLNASDKTPEKIR